MRKVTTDMTIYTEHLITNVSRYVTTVVNDLAW